MIGFLGELPGAVSRGTAGRGREGGASGRRAVSARFLFVDEGRVFTASKTQIRAGGKVSGEGRFLLTGEPRAASGARSETPLVKHGPVDHGRLFLSWIWTVEGPENDPVRRSKQNACYFVSSRNY